MSAALGSAPSSVNPVKATDATGMRLVSLIYQSFVRIGKDLRPTGDLAHKWIQENGTLTFYISSDVHFSDGSQITCEDLEKSILKYQDRKCPFNSAFKNITSVECKTVNEDLLLSFHTTTDIEKFLLADLPVLKITKGDLGTGAFTIKENKPTHSFLVRNPHHSKPQKYDIKLFYIKDDLARFLKVYKGEIDIAPNSIPFEKMRAFSDTKMKIFEEASLSTAYLLINHKNKDLQNLDFRKKIYETLNIPELVEHRFDNHVTLAKSLLAPSHPYHSPLLEKISHSSKTLFRNKSQLKFKTSNTRQTRETAQIISHKLNAEKISTKLESFEWGTFYKDVKSGRYDIALMKWVGVVDPDLYNLAFHSSEFPPGRNRGHYKNTELDKILEAGRKAPNREERFRLYSKAQDMVFKNLAIIPLWHENQIHVIHPRIQNYSLNPMGDFSSLLNLEISND